MWSDPTQRDRWLIALGLLLAALGLRTTVTSLPPFASRIEHDLGISAAAVGVLTSLPVLCMALLGVAAHHLASRRGRATTLLASLICVAAGNCLRLGGDHVAILFAATLLAGIGVAGAGVMLPGIVKASFPRRFGPATAACAAAMLLGAAAAGALAVPLGELLGSWEAALAFWALPVLPGVLAWTWLIARGGADTEPSDPLIGTSSPRLPWSTPAAWLLGGFFALQSSLGYAYLAWLPATYEDRGWSEAAAGSLVGVLHLAQLATALVLPLLAVRRVDRRPVLLVATSLTLIAAIWFVVLPDSSPVAATVLVGLGLGGGFSLSLLLIVDFAADAVGSTALAAMTFLVGYCVAALAPIAIGALSDTGGGFGTSLVVLVVLAAAQFALATRLGPRYRGTVTGTRGTRAEIPHAIS